MYPGIADRMQKELTSLTPSSMKVSYAAAYASIISFCLDYRLRSLHLRKGNILSGLEVPFLVHSFFSFLLLS
jgi:hypothetical protein